MKIKVEELNKPTEKAIQNFVKAVIKVKGGSNNARK